MQTYSDLPSQQKACKKCGLRHLGKEDTMRNFILAIALLFGTALSVSAQEQKSAAVQNADAAWQQVSRITTQQSVKVYLTNGEALKGALVRVEENGIVLRLKKDKSIQISREDILRICLRSRAKGALIGLGVCAGLGAALGSAKPSEHLGRGGTAVAAASGWGAIGALIGSAMTKEQTIYPSPQH